MTNKTYSVNSTDFNALAYNYAYDIVDSLNKGYYDADCVLYEVIIEEVDRDMIYYADQWKLLQEYFNPQDLTQNALADAFEMLCNDIFSMIDCEETEEE